MFYQCKIRWPNKYVFPNQFPLDEPGKLEIQFDDLLVENLQRKWQVKK